MPSLVLASASPRRQELLKLLTPDFHLAVSNVEATRCTLRPPWPVAPLPLPPEFQIAEDSHPTLWAWRKAVDVAAQDDTASNSSFVLAADTVVIGRGRLLGKPSDPHDATDMLRALRGKPHYVATGYALVHLVETLGAGAALSCVYMRDYSEEELQGYVATGEPRDKAGAYAVQGLGGRLVSRVEGCYFNVVGLPLCEVRQLLSSAGVPLLAYPESGYCAVCPKRQATR
jgi:septum formation protein